MDLATLKQRKADLEVSATQMSNNWQIIQGHKGECDYWIAEIEKAALVVPDEVPVE